MPVIDGRTWLEILEPPTCWRLLRLGHVGRLGYVVEGEPEIVPINYAIDGETIVFRTAAGTKLAALRKTDAVAFEIDHADPASQTGWSVLVKGRAERVSDTEELHRLRELPLRPWALGHKEAWVRVSPTSVTGRAIYQRPDDDRPADLSAEEEAELLGADAAPMDAATPATATDDAG